MPTTVGAACSECGFPIAVGPSQVGTVVTCPNCGASNEIVARRGVGRIANIGADVGVTEFTLGIVLSGIFFFLVGQQIALKRRSTLGPLPEKI